MCVWVLLFLVLFECVKPSRKFLQVNESVIVFRNKLVVLLHHVLVDPQIMNWQEPVEPNNVVMCTQTLRYEFKRYKRCTSEDFIEKYTKINNKFGLLAIIILK